MRISREALAKATAILQADLETRVFEGAAARVRRYFTDRDLAKRIVVAKAAKKATEVP